MPASISGTGTLTVDGDGDNVLTLSGTNTLSGRVHIAEGTLVVDTESPETALASAFVDIDEGSTFRLNSSATVASFAGAGSVVVDAANTLSSGDANDRTFSGVISGAGSLTKQGDGTLTLSGENTYQGETVVNAGTLTITNDLGLGSADGATTVNSGGTLDLSSVDVAGEDLTLNGGTLSDATSSWGGTIALSSDSTISIASGDTLTVGGEVSGTGSLTKQGDGTLS